MKNNITKVGIIGAGTMGRRIAFACLIHGKKTRIYDISRRTAGEARRSILELIGEGVSSGRFSQGTLDSAASSLSICAALQECVSGADLVIEAVPERLDLKRNILAEIDPITNQDTLIATNSSSITGSQLADVLKQPGRFVNLHFGLHDDIKVDVMGHPRTGSNTIEAVIKFVKSLKLVPILVKREIMGYAANRVWRAVKKEVLFLLDGGYSHAEDIDRGWMLEWGTSFGPCGAMDMIGLDVVYDIEKMYYDSTGDISDKPPEMLIRMIAQGQLGVKSGEGFYKYPNPAYKHPGWLKGDD